MIAGLRAIIAAALCRARFDVDYPAGVPVVVRDRLLSEADAVIAALGGPDPRHSLCGGHWRGPVSVDDELLEVCTSCGAERHVEGIGGGRARGEARPGAGFTHAQRTASDNASF